MVDLDRAIAAEAELLEEYGGRATEELRRIATILNEIPCMRICPEMVLDAFALLAIDEAKRGAHDTDGLLRKAKVCSDAARQVQEGIESIEWSRL